MGAERAQTYLVLLQNTAERRPNGGFFGSFAVVEIEGGLISDIEIMDSYLPSFDSPDARVTGPWWLEEFLPDRDIHFVGANKVGFTYQDGSHIQRLYEKAYPGKRVRGVIFVSTDVFEKLLPEFREQLWEWQFVNASVDLIRGQDRWGKKSFISMELTTFYKNIVNV